MLAHIIEAGADLSVDLVTHLAGDADASRLDQRLQSCGDIDTITKEIIALNDHFAQIDTNAPDEVLRLGQGRVHRCHVLLQFKSA